MVSKDKLVRTKRHGGRVVLSLDVEPRVRDAIRERASLIGVSMAEYITNAVAIPERSFMTAAAEIAQPLTVLSYKISRARELLRSGDSLALGLELEDALRIVAEALLPLAAPHAEEVRRLDRRRAGGWRG